MSFLRTRARVHATTVPTVLGLALVATLVTGTTPAPADATCDSPPAIAPESQLVPGVSGNGMTAIAGTTPVPFTFRVVGVIPDGWMLGIDAVVIRVTGPASFLAQTGGVFYGMSGSPAYVGGKLAGAVSGGFYEDPTYGVLTPAQAMVDLVDDPATASTMAERIAPTEPIRAAIAADEGVSPAEVTGTFRRLPVLLGVSGLSDAAVGKLQHRIHRHGEDVRVFAAGSSADVGGPVQATQFQPGEPLGAAISYGDASIFATGTATFVCGDVVAAFGHPLFYEAPGSVSLGLAGASGLAVIGGDLFPGARYANLTEPRGTIVSDNFAGDVGVIGQEPSSVPITSDLTNLDTGATRQGETEGFFTDGYWLEELVWAHLYGNIAAVSGHFGGGSTTLDWTIEGEREDGSPFTVANHAMAASDYDAGEAVYQLISQIEALQYNGREELDVTSVSTIGSTSQHQLSAEISDLQLASPMDPRLAPRHVIRAHPGDRVTVQVTLDPADPSLDPAMPTFTLVVPRRGHGDRRITMLGGSGWWDGHGRIRSVDALLEALNDGTHADDLVVTGLGQKVRRQPYVVLGRARFTIDVVR